jgi:hypothetical protein
MTPKEWLKSTNVSDRDFMEIGTTDIISDLIEGYVKDVLKKDWVKIESEKDLPESDGLFFLFGDGETGLGRFCKIQKTFKTFNGNIYDGVTHYQQIIKPNNLPS